MDPDQRSKTIDEIHSIIQRPVHRVLWAVLQVCDEKGLYDVLKIARLGSGSLFETQQVSIVADGLSTLPLYWQQRVRKQTQDSAPSTSAPSTPVSPSPFVTPSGRSPVPSPAESSTSSHGRKKEADDKVSTPRNVALISPSFSTRKIFAIANTVQCRERDKARCVLTGLPRPEVAHIYPHCMLGTPPNRHMFWELLADYWSQGQITRWMSPLFRDTGSTGCDVKIFWLNHYTFLPKRVNLNIKPAPPHEGAIGPEGAKLYNTATDQPIKSGDVIELTTDDPDLRPLPSIDLLYMQWVLQQIAALAAGAEPINLEEVDSDDDDNIDVPVALLEGEDLLY
ncbi:hypothetical protein K432DRAFT_403996 [Lepidopterella palustris CBS 459.81]|uniref:HNH nuclease domain-containing protein n=1 Tax=Lepidopterella palustris CBS 459.81 TaxID=1314670 RepID=A0A8E2EC06_9PEZI|nr:hypothetical protein K432DRAFT_403996 [Lepidopterella palustris CBS 459.81]